MVIPVAVKQVNWIHRHAYRGVWTHTYIYYLDSALRSSFLNIHQGEEAESIWQAFLALPAVHVFPGRPGGQDLYAYNFAHIERSIQSGSWGGFLYYGDEGYLATLKSPFDDAMGPAMASYHRWILDQSSEGEGEPQDTPTQNLEVIVPLAQKELAQAHLIGAFPGGRFEDETEESISYLWHTPLVTILTEEQRMRLGLFEHVLSVANPRISQDREPITRSRQARYQISYSTADAVPPGRTSSGRSGILLLGIAGGVVLLGMALFRRQRKNSATHLLSLVGKKCGGSYDYKNSRAGKQLRNNSLPSMKRIDDAKITTSLL